MIVETEHRNESASKSLTVSKIGQAVEIRPATTTGTAEVIATESGIGRGTKNGTGKETARRIKTAKENAKRVEGNENDTDVTESLLVARNGIAIVIRCHLRLEEYVGRRTEPRMNHLETSHPAIALMKSLISAAAKMRYVRLILFTILELC